MFCALSLALLATSTPPSDEAPTTEGGPLQVLILGNSFISFFDIAEQLNNLTNAAGLSANFVRFGLASATLGAPQPLDLPHDVNPASNGLICSAPWDFVILQEQSCIPTLPLAKVDYMRTGAFSLDAKIKANNPATQTLMFQTWGYEGGGVCCYGPECSVDFPDYGAMQDALTASYAEIACGLGAGVIPAGEGWRRALEVGPPTTLYDPDGFHPSFAGTYLNACIVYGMVFGQSPVGNSYKGALTINNAAFFQQIAHDIVFGPNAYSLSCTGPSVYCTGKVSSDGCMAYIGATDIMTDPVSGGLDYSITATNVQGFKNGLLVASPFGAAALPFNGGLLCVQPPTRRGAIQSSLGTFGVCDGSFSQVVNDGMMLPFGLDAGPGNTAWYQYWYRDPQNGAGQLGTALSNGIAVDFL